MDATMKENHSRETKFPVEKRLKLVQQIRSQYNRNQYDMMNREQILYGRTSPEYAKYNKGVTWNKGDIWNKDTLLEPYGSSSEVPITGTFKVRFLAAIILAIMILALDISGNSIFGLQASDIFESIGEEFRVDSIGFIEKIIHKD